jgi:hypothetical protein
MFGLLTILNSGLVISLRWHGRVAIDSVCAGGDGNGLGATVVATLPATATTTQERDGNNNG